MVYKYGFEEYWEDAKGNPTPENLETLAEWFKEFSPNDWNGEAYIIDKTTCLRPIYSESFEDTNCYPTIIGWELKNY